MDGIVRAEERGDCSGRIVVEVDEWPWSCAERNARNAEEHRGTKPEEIRGARHRHGGGPIRVTLLDPQRLNTGLSQYYPICRLCAEVRIPHILSYCSLAASMCG